LWAQAAVDKSSETTIAVRNGRDMGGFLSVVMKELVSIECTGRAASRERGWHPVARTPHAG
jgi:hypothetical protein